METKSEKPQIKDILLVDDDRDVLDTIQFELESLGYSVHATTQSKEAQKLIRSKTPFKLLVSDIRMPELSGLELLSEVRKTIQIPVVLMTGFSDLADTKKADDLGVDGFVAKPFRRDELLKIIQNALKPKPISLSTITPEAPHSQASQVNLEAEYSKIGIEQFLSGSQIEYDVFIKLSASKFVKIAHTGEDLSLERIRNYKSKDIRFLYMRKEDFRKYVGFSMALAKRTKSLKVSKSKQLEIMRNTGEVILEQIYTDQINQTIFYDAKTVIESTLELITEDADLVAMIDILNDHSDYLYGHSLGVSLYSVMIAQKMGISKSLELFKIALGSLLHDIGKKSLPKELVNKPKTDFTPEERKIYETHAEEGAKMIEAVPSVSPEVARIVREHHENCLGTGFPNKLSADQINQKSKIVSTANIFCGLIIKNPDGEGIKPRVAIKRLTDVFAEVLDPITVQALEKILEVR